VRDDHEVIGADVEAARARPLGEHSDDGEPLEADPHLLADRIEAGEERLGRALPEHHHAGAAIDFGPGEEAAAFDRDVDRVVPIGAAAEDGQWLRALAPVEDALGLPAATLPERDVDGL